jgi:hypothetical protein
MSMTEDTGYVQYLPRVFQQKSGQSDEDYFLGRFLKAFEAMLSGKTGAATEEFEGLEALLDGFHGYLDPDYTSAQLLTWLAGWVGLELEEGVEYEGEQDKQEKTLNPLQLLPLKSARSSVNRSLIGTAVQLYKKRGTLEGLKEYLQVYAGQEAEIDICSYEEPVRCGMNRRAGINTMVGAADSNYFSVHVLLPSPTRTMLDRKVQIMREVIRKERPFYTNFSLNIEVPQMRVGVYGRVGMETLLGGMAEK